MRSRMGFRLRQSGSRLITTLPRCQGVSGVYLSTQRNRKVNKTKDQRSKEANHKKRYSWPWNTHKYIQAHNQRNAILNTEILFILIKLKKIKNLSACCWPQSWAMNIPIYCWWESKLVSPLWRAMQQYLSKALKCTCPLTLQFHF